MRETIEIFVDGFAVETRPEMTVAAALLSAGRWTSRRSVSGQMRGPLCAMGICYECRVTIDGISSVRSCLAPVVPGMRIETDG